MVSFAGIKFRNSTKIHYVHPQGELHYGDRIIAEGPQGIDCGIVVLPPMELSDEKAPGPIREMLRLADAADREKEENNIRREKEAYHICKEKIAQRGLEMKLIRAECPFDDTRILFYFTADGRIDFRELVKDLASVFRTRIELRQVGVRDETKLLGGIGICGRPLCCHTYLTEFAPVSIKMAKEQSLSLNPTKISGTCGRLMCCLKNEADTYSYLSKGLPAKGDQMTAPDGLHGEVLSVDILRQRVRCVVVLGDDERESRDYHISEITFEPHSKRPKQPNAPKAERKKKETANAPEAKEAPAREYRGRVIDDGVEEAPEAEPEISLEEEFLAISGDIPTPIRKAQKNGPKASNPRQKNNEYRTKNDGSRKNSRDRWERGASGEKPDKAERSEGGRKNRENGGRQRSQGAKDGQFRREKNFREGEFEGGEGKNSRPKRNRRPQTGGQPKKEEKE